MRCIKRVLSFLLFFILYCSNVSGQPVYTFSVKVGIDRETVDTLGGEGAVREKCRRMFERINGRFNNGQLDGIYDFQVDWDAFYIYEGNSRDEVFKPHPGHDYLVVMDGFVNHEAESGGGWFGGWVQTIYHVRLEIPGRVSDPFDAPTATDALIHEFGHARGIPDIYAMAAYDNPVNGMKFHGVRCMMNNCYGETVWSDYAVNIMNRTRSRARAGDIANRAFPEEMYIEVSDRRGRPVSGAAVNLYPVRFYSYAVTPEKFFSAMTDADGRVLLPRDIYAGNKDFRSLEYANFFVEAVSGDGSGYAWLPLYIVQNAFFEGRQSYVLDLMMK